MPHLTVPLARNLAILDLLVGVSTREAQAIRQTGQTIAAPVALRGLIDTGAAHTCLDSRFIQRLGLTAIGSVKLFTPSSGTTPVAFTRYNVSLTLVHASLPRGRCRLVKTLRVLEADLQPMGDDALIGLDVLSHCRFVYDGKKGTVSLTF